MLSEMCTGNCFTDTDGKELEAVSEMARQELSLLQLPLNVGMSVDRHNCPTCTCLQITG